MQPILRRSALALCCLPLSGIAQDRRPEHFPNPDSADRNDIQLPNGKSQRDEILKAEHEQNLKDVARLADLADELKQTMEKEDRFVFSLNTMKKAEEIEKLAHKIRSRMRHDLSVGSAGGLCRRSAGRRTRRSGRCGAVEKLGRRRMGDRRTRGLSRHSD